MVESERLYDTPGRLFVAGATHSGGSDIQLDYVLFRHFCLLVKEIDGTETDGLGNTMLD